MATATADLEKRKKAIREAQQAAEQPVVYPTVAVGDVVDYWDGADANTEVPAVPAIVTKVEGGGQHQLAILPPDNYGFKLLESSVRHKSDPVAKRLVGIDPDMGVWDINPDRLTKSEVAAVRRLLADFPETTNPPAPKPETPAA